MNKNQVKDIESLEEYYNKCRKIKFKTFQPKSIEDLFFAVAAQSFDFDNSTVYNKGGHHCYKGKHRSICDYIKLSKYYYPNKSVKDILKVIDDNLNKENPYSIYNCRYITIGYCSVIRKNNFFGNAYYNNYSKNKFDNYYFIDNGFPNFNLKIKDIL